MPENNFELNGYLVLRGVIDPAVLFSHIKSLDERKKMSSDGQVVGSSGIYKEEKFESLLEDLIPTLESQTGRKLYKTYSYARIYKLGQILKSHRDRDACEISATMCLGYSEKPWPIWLNDTDERAVSVTLEPGDVLVYKGTEVAHWREKNTFGPCAQVFLHYVDQSGPFAYLGNNSLSGPRRFRLKFNIAKFNVDFNLTLQKKRLT